MGHTNPTFRPQNENTEVAKLRLQSPATPLHLHSPSSSSLLDVYFGSLLCLLSLLDFSIFTSNTSPNISNIYWLALASPRYPKGVVCRRIRLSVCHITHPFSSSTSTSRIKTGYFNRETVFPIRKL